MSCYIRRFISEKAYVDYGFVPFVTNDYFYQSCGDGNRLFINRKTKEVSLDYKVNSIDFFLPLLRMYNDKIIEFRSIYD